MPIRKRAKASDDKAPAHVLQPSILKVFDIPLALLDGDELNPNEMAEDKFDLLVQEIQDNGFDEPIIVIPNPRAEGRYLIAGGHHRKKAAAQLGMAAIPAVIKESWDEDQQKLALVKRNIVHGKMNNVKFTKLYNDLAKKYDPKLLQTMLGFTQTKEFDAVYEGISKSLNTKQKKTLAKAKEKIKSVDDLSAVLHKIFKEEGSEADHSYVVFSFGGKKHHYVQVDDETEKALSALKAQYDARGESLTDFIVSTIKAAAPTAKQKVAPKKKRPIRKTDSK